MNKLFLSIMAAAVLSTAVFASAVIAQTPVETHYAPTENLEHIDARLLRSARKSIDFAAYTFTSFPVIDALADAARRGVKVRVLLDPSQAGMRKGAALVRLESMAKIAGVEVRVKRGGDLMHLKSYAVDGTMLRTGSANFTASGLKRQNNDLIVIHDGKAAGHFGVEFQSAFESGAKWPQ